MRHYITIKNFIPRNDMLNLSKLMTNIRNIEEFSLVFIKCASESSLVSSRRSLLSYFNSHYIRFEHELNLFPAIMPVAKFCNVAKALAR